MIVNINYMYLQHLNDDLYNCPVPEVKEVFFLTQTLTVEIFTL